MRTEVERWSNCRLKREREKLLAKLIAVEEEIEKRLGKGGGGLK